MIYEGAIIRRLVTPNYPGDPALDDPTVEIQCRVEYVKADRGGRDFDWTKDFSAALRYPRHLDADRRAQEIGGMAHARVATADGAEPFSNLSGARTETAASPSGVGTAATSSAPAQPILPAEGRPSVRATKRRPEVHDIASAQSTSRKPRAAGKNNSQTAPTVRLKALRASAARTDARWWETGQYA